VCLAAKSIIVYGNGIICNIISADIKNKTTKRAKIFSIFEAVKGVLLTNLYQSENLWQIKKRHSRFKLIEEQIAHI